MIKKAVFLVIGCIGLALGAVGMFLPIIPTVPFFLLAAFGFAKSSKKLDDWFRGTKMYKNNLESFVRGQGMTKKSKIKIVSMVTVIMVIGFIMMSGSTVGRICLGVVWVAHIVAFAFFIKTKQEDQPEQVEEGTDIQNQVRQDEVEVYQNQSTKQRTVSKAMLQREDA